MADLDDILDAHEREVEKKREKDQEEERRYERTYEKALHYLPKDLLIPAVLKDISKKLKARGHGSTHGVFPSGAGAAITISPEDLPGEYRLEFLKDGTEERFTARAVPALPGTDLEWGPAGERATVAMEDLSVDLVRDTTSEWIADVFMADMSPKRYR